MNLWQGSSNPPVGPGASPASGKRSVSNGILTRRMSELRLTLVPFLLILLTSCANLHVGYVPRCRTTCGMEGDFGETNCQALQEAENKALLAFHQHGSYVDKNFMCDALIGVRMSIHSHTQQDDAHGCTYPAWWGGRICVLGQSRFGRPREVEVESANFDKNSFTHELAHIFDHWFNINNSPTHCGWTESHVKDAIRDVTGKEDETEENCSPTQKPHE